eukprot:TRINITY_DN648_c0_g1_i1.p1 TRINITY_DN648_c0_g1~~TRINITY_DN648_c0_g1_i1.p1  ORF type:complete len:744 (-),score=143.08 TRINITY_DN648_c0_g1_i1:3-2234(-)
MLRFSVSKISQSACEYNARRRAQRSNNLPSQFSPLSASRLGPVQCNSTTVLDFIRKRKYHSSRRVQGEETAEQSSPTPKKAEASTGESIRSAMRQFLFRVHPDFFSKYPSVQQSNERALKQVNQLLDILEDYSNREGPIILDGNKVPKKLTVAFFLRELKASTEQETPDSVAEPAEASKGGKKKGEKQLRNVTATIAFPDSFFNTPFPRQRLDHDCRVFINALLKQAGLPTVELPDIGIPSEKKKKEEKQQGTTEKREKVLWAHEMRSLIYKALNRHYTHDQMVLDSLGGRIILQQGPDKLPYELDSDEKESFERLYQYRENTTRLKRSVFFVPQLTGEQKGIASRALELLWASKRIPEDIPVLITQNTYFTPTQIQGFITLPHNFYLENPLNPAKLQEDEKKEDGDKKSDAETNPDASEGSSTSKVPKLNAEQYLSLYLPTIIEQRAKIRDAIVETELGLTEILETLKVADVVVKVGLLDARPAINRIVKALRTLSTLDGATTSQEVPDEPLKQQKEDSDITEEMEAEFMDELEFGTKPINDQKSSKSKAKKAKKDQKNAKQEQQQKQEQHDEQTFTALDLLRNVTMHIVKGGVAEYDADRDVFLVPASITADGFKEALAEHRPMLEMRQRLNPHALEFASDYWKLLEIISKLANVREIVLDGAAVKNKIVQVHGAQTLKRHAAELRAMNFGKIGIVIADRFGVDKQRELLYVPPVFEMQDLHQFLSLTAEAQHLHPGRPFQ